MFVSNLTNRNLGLASPVVLRPNEINRYIDEDDTRLVESVWRAKAANLVSVSETEGLVKTITTTAVKTLTFDAGAMSKKPRSSSKHTEEVEKVLKERVTKESKKAEPKVETEAQETKSVKEEEEALKVEEVEATASDEKKTKKAKK